MKVTAELSLYPFSADYISVIKAFIQAVNEHGDLDIETTPTSTRISGDYDRVFALVRQELKASFRNHGRQVLVCKFIPDEDDPTA